MKSSILGYASVLALATGAAVIGQNQPTNTPARTPTTTQPTTTQPTTTQPATNQPRSAQPGTAQPGTNSRTGDDDTRWREMADKFDGMNRQMSDRNEELARKLAQAQMQSGDARVTGIAEVLTGVLQEQRRAGQAIIRLQRLAFQGHLNDSGMSGEWDSWKQQYPFLDESKDSDDTGASNIDRDRENKDRTTNPGDVQQPRSPR